MGHHTGAYSAAEKAKKWAIGAIAVGLCVLVVIAAYLGFYFGYLRDHYMSTNNNNYYPS